MLNKRFFFLTIFLVTLFSSNIFPLEKTVTTKIPKNLSPDIQKIINLLEYTKRDNSGYRCQKFVTGYHSFKLGDTYFKGQRDPQERLNLLDFDFTGKTVLDIGTNQGGMLFPLAKKIKNGIGIDYDAKKINAANKIKSFSQHKNLDFYVFDLDNEDLAMISNFLPAEKIDICFLLAICMHIKKWHEVIDYAAKISNNLFFEANGQEYQQQEQYSYLKEKYNTVKLLAETSEDDPTFKKRKVYFCSNTKKQSQKKIDPLEILNKKERALIRKHAPTWEEKIILDNVFNNLDREALDLFSEKKDFSSIEEIRTILEKNGFEVLTIHWKTISDSRDSNVIVIHPALPEYVLKIGFSKERYNKNISRILYADEINNLIKNPANNLNNIKPVHKKLYHIPYRPYEVNDFNYIILAPKIDGVHMDQAGVLPTELIDELLRLDTHFKQLGYGHFHDFDGGASNILITPDNKAAIIDTEIVMGDTRKKWFKKVLDR